MKKILMLFLGVITTISIIYGDTEIDSLFAILPDASINERICALNTLAAKFWYIDPDSSLTFANEALILSQEENNKTQEALAYHRLGGAYYFLSDYNRALENYNNSLRIRKEIDDDLGVANISNNLGMIYQEMGSYDKALDSYMIALQYHESQGNTGKTATLLNNIGAVYGDIEQHDKALLSYLHSLELKQRLDDNEGVAITLHNIGRVYTNLHDFDRALEYYDRALEMKRIIGNQYSIAITLNNIGEVYFELENYEDALSFLEEALQIEQLVGDRFGEANTLNNIGHVYLMQREFEKAENVILRALTIAEEIEAKYVMEASYLYLSAVYENYGQYRESLKYYKQMVKINWVILGEEVRDKVAQLQARYEFEKKDNEINLLLKERNIHQLTIEKEKVFRNYLIVFIFFIILITIILYISYRLKKKDNKLIAQEKAKSDKLLMNIFPVRVVNDLKETGKTEPALFKNVTIYYSDLVGFTNRSATLAPKELINELNDIFNSFDEIMDKYDCERIKTIGDAYLAVGGMNNANEQSSINIVKAAREHIEYLEKRNERSNVTWHIRVGIHTGDIVGGVVGVKKYIYDVFGETINIAARMEQYSDTMKINISEDTYQYIQSKFLCEERDGIIVRGRGIVKMYYIEGEV